MTPFFSIVIPVYNVAPYLRECLDSVLAQTFTDWEAICVDDGSTDGSDVILDEYAKRDKRFRVIHKPNAGVSAARNVALENVAGRYIGFIDADDAIARDWLSHSRDCIETLDADVVRFELQPWRGEYRNEAEWDCKALILGDKKRIFEWGWEKYLSNQCGGPWNIFAKASIVKGKIFFPVGMRMKEDRIFIIRLIIKAKKLVYIDYKGYFYRMRMDGACGSLRRVADVIRYIDEIYSLVEECHNAIAKYGFNNALCTAITHTVESDITELMELGDFKEWRTCREIPVRVRMLWKDGLLKLRYIRTRYVFAFATAIMLNSMKGFIAIRGLILLYRSLRQKLV